MTRTTQAPDPGPALEALLGHWFDIGPSEAGTDSERLERKMRQWFASTPDEDRMLAERFGGLAAAAAQGSLDSFADSPHGRLALIILLDQLPRNLYRGRPEAFAADPKALALAEEGISSGAAARLSPLERVFFCMPMQHAESLAVQRRSIEVYEALAAGELTGPLAAILEKTAEFARLHHEIIQRFGRFPHRNAALGRRSTAEEAAWLESGGPSFGQ